MIPKKKILDQIRRFVVPGVVFPDALCVLVITLAETKSDKIRQMGLRITSCSFNRCSRESSFHSIIGSYYLICLTGPQWSRAGREVIIGCFVYVNSLTCTWFVHLTASVMADQLLQVGHLYGIVVTWFIRTSFQDYYILQFD